MQSSICVIIPTNDIIDIKNENKNLFTIITAMELSASANKNNDNNN